MKRLIREPLFHFLLIGALLFVLYSVMNQGNEGSDRRIVVPAGLVENLEANFTKIWQRPPSQDELTGLVDAHIKEEILSREAIRLGLDRHDPVIRRRLQQKMEFMVEDFAALAEPTDEQLQEFLEENSADFAQDARYTFRHVFLNPEERGDTMQTAVTDLLKQLRDGGESLEIAELGDRLLLPREFVKEPGTAVRSQFGREFSEALDDVNVGEWTGPIASAYGLHVVHVHERTPGRVPNLDEVRRKVRRDFIASRREQIEKRFLDELLDQYTIVVEWPEPAVNGVDGKPTAAQNP